LITTELVIYATLVYLLAGTIKGTVGIGLPTAAIGILSQFTDPRLAISLVVFPILFSNLWQVFREGNLVESIKGYWLFALSMMLVLGATTLVTARIDTSTLIFILGVVIFLFAITSLLVMPPDLPQRYDRAAQFFGGTIAGVLGGLTAIWAPPVVIYLMSKRLDKDEFVRVMGMFLLAGSIPLTIGFWQVGLLSGETALLSAGMIVPTLLGFSLGEVLRRRLDAQRFRTILLMVFLVMGLNLIRKAVF